MSALLCLLSVLSVRAQVSSHTPWIWMHGDKSGHISSSYGAIRIPAASNKPGSRTMPVSWSDAEKRLWLFGGFGDAPSGNGRLNDLWQYDLALNQWIWMSGDSTINENGVYGKKGVAAPSNKPGARSGSARWTDTAGNLWLWGGFGFGAANSTNHLLNDLWVYNTETNAWTWVAGDSTMSYPNGIYGKKGVRDVSNYPGARHGAVSWVDEEGDFWLFGGTGYAANGLDGYLNDLWKYEVRSGQWTWVSGDTLIDAPAVYGVQGIEAPANKPGGRVFSSGWRDTAGDFWLMGGEYMGACYNDLWLFNKKTSQWVWMKGDSQPDQNGIYGRLDTPAAGNKPGARFGAASWSDAYNNLYILGGIGFGSSGKDFINDFWRYTPSDNSWAWLKGDSLVSTAGTYGSIGIQDSLSMPGARNMSAYWTDYRGQFWIMGGDGYAEGGRPTVMNDLWKLNNCIHVQAPVSIDGLTEVCEGAVVTYSATPVPWAVSYHWTWPTGWSGQVSGNALTLTAGNNDGFITISALSSCDTSEELSFAVQVNRPDAIITAEGFLLSTSIPFETYQWFLDGKAIAGGTKAKQEVIGNGRYIVVVSDHAGCIDTSDVYAVTNYTGIKTPAGIQVSISPNPATAVIAIHTSTAVTVTLTALDGRVIATYEDPEMIRLDRYTPGIYLVRIDDKHGNRIRTEKLIKQ